MNPMLLTGLAGNILGGYLLGQNQRQMQMENQEIEQKKLKILMDAQKIKDAKEERAAAEEERKAATRQKLIEMGLANHGLGTDLMPTSTSGPGFGVGFGEDSDASRAAQTTPRPNGLVDILASDPLLAFVLKEETGMDLPGMVEARRKATSDERDERKFGWQRDMDLLRGQGVTYIKTKDPATGIERDVPMPTNPALAGMRPGMPMMGGGIPPQAPPAGLGSRPPVIGGGGGLITGAPKPEAVDVILPEGQKGKQYRNPYTGQMVGDPWATDEKQPLSGEAAGRAGMLTSSLESLMQAKAILMPGGELRQDWRKVVGAGPVPGLNAFVPGARDFDSHIENALAAKLRLETGANMPATEKTNLDKRFKPSPLDSETLAKSKMDSLERFMRGSIEMLDPNKKYSADAIKFTATDGKKYAWEPGKSGAILPPAAVKALKEGTVTVFGNGKKYTIRNGQPVEVP